jgi:hypothetical protein
MLTMYNGTFCTFGDGESENYLAGPDLIKSKVK